MAAAAHPLESSQQACCVQCCKVGQLAEGLPPLPVLQLCQPIMSMHSLFESMCARRIGLREATATPLLVARTKAEVAGTLLTAQLALKHGLACNTAGGTHHAFRCGGHLARRKAYSYSLQLPAAQRAVRPCPSATLHPACATQPTAT
jgi:hypothetical protein